MLIYKLNQNEEFSPFITHPIATNASNFFIFFLIIIGISKTPGTFNNLIFVFFFFNVIFSSSDKF